MPIFVIEIVFEIVIEIGKPCSTTQKIVIEIVIQIGMEQTRLFQCNRFHCADFVIEIVFEIVIEIVIEICVEQTRLFQWNRFHYAENLSLIHI